MADAAALVEAPSRPGLLETLGDGTMAGLYGASTVALWFFVVDFWLREPLFTPALVGSMLLGVLGVVVEGEVNLSAVAFYTAVHGAAFSAFGIVYAWVLARMSETPDFPLISIAVFVPLELGFVAATRFVVPGAADVIGHGAIVVGNALAALSMALYLRFGQPHRDDRPEP